MLLGCPDQGLGFDKQHNPASVSVQTWERQEEAPSSTGLVPSNSETAAFAIPP